MSKNFKEVMDCILVNRHRYKDLTDEDKEDNFFIINRKLGKKYPKIAQLFNNKNVDKPSSIDRWYLLFEGSTSIPQWYWDPKKEEKKKSKEKPISKREYQYLMEKYNLKESDIDFLLEYNSESVKEELHKSKHNI